MGNVKSHDQRYNSTEALDVSNNANIDSYRRSSLTIEQNEYKELPESLSNLITIKDCVNTTLDINETNVEHNLFIEPKKCSENVNIEIGDPTKDFQNEDINEVLAPFQLDANPTFNVNLILEKGLEKDHLQGELEFAPDYLNFIIAGHRKPKKIIAYWPYNAIRKYGQGDDMFMIESGRKGSSGEGYYVFETVQPSKIYKVLHDRLARLLNNGCIPSQSKPSHLIDVKLSSSALTRKGSDRPIGNRKTTLSSLHLDCKDNRNVPTSTAATNATSILKDPMPGKDQHYENLNSNNIDINEPTDSPLSCSNYLIFCDSAIANASLALNNPPQSSALNYVNISH